MSTLLAGELTHDTETQGTKTHGTEPYQRSKEQIRCDQNPLGDFLNDFKTTATTPSGSLVEQGSRAGTCRGIIEPAPEPSPLETNPE